MAKDGLCECGCGRPTKIAPYSSDRFGWKRGEPMRFIHGHRVRTLYGKCDFSKPQYTVDEHGCWVWNHGTGTKGYGKIGGEYAHRVFYRRYKGEIPDGMVIDHLCANRLCVNPCHLEPVSDAENKHRCNDMRLGRRSPLYPICSIKQPH